MIAALDKTPVGLVTLDEMLVLADSGTWGDEATAQSGSPVLRSTNIQDDMLLLDNPAWRTIPVGDAERRRLLDGDIIVTKSSGSEDHIGKCGIFHEPQDGHSYYFSNFMLRLRTHPERLSPRYLFYWLTSPRGRAEVRRLNSTTSGLRNISVPQYREQKLPIPYPGDWRRSLAEQKRIATILDTADAIRRKRREANQCVSDLAPSIFYRLFAPWLQKPTSEMPRLGSPDLADIASGVTKGRRFNGQPTVIVPYIRVANVQDGFLDLAEIKTIEALPSDVEELRLQRGDVLMTEGGDFDKLGRGAMWEADIPDCIHQNHVFRVRCNRKNLLPIYFAHFIRTQLAKSYFLSCAKKTSNLASMNLTQLKGTPVACPPIALQERFAAEMQTLGALRNCQSAAIAASDDLFAGLVQRAFRGEL